MNFGSIIPPGLERPYTFGYELKTKAKNITSDAQSLRLTALQNEYRVFKSLGTLGQKGLQSVAKRADSLARQSLSPLEYHQSKGIKGSPFTRFRLDV